MTLLKITAIIILTLTLKSSSACDCAYEGPFLKMADKAKFVALVKVSKYTRFKKLSDGTTVPVTMQVEIVEKYKGDDARKEITVFGDIGHFCRPYLSNFTQGAYYVIAFYPGDSTFGHVKETASDYYISACGEYWLTVNKQKTLARGGFATKNEVITLVSLKCKLKQNGN